MEIKTPSGQSVTLKEADQLTHGDRKAIMSIDQSGNVPRGFVLTDNLLANVIVDWSYDLLLPSVKIESLDKLSPADVDAIAEAAQPLVEALMPTRKVDDPKVSPAS